ncbi:MAG: hypothetical protein EOO09_20790 [Chitinophagaceae bacterium]|nr:MAG: hypothetical protein EOO09_20790 [Chitinophagaceae bacterium]
MQTRVRKIASFFAFNILFFGLYLNFIDRDRTVGAADQIGQPAAAFGAAVLHTHLEKSPVTTVALIK